MKVFVCNCLPNGMESGGLVVAETEEQARLKLKEMVNANEYQVDIDKIELVEIDTSKSMAMPIDPNGYNFEKAK